MANTQLVDLPAMSKTIMELQVFSWSLGLSAAISVLTFIYLLSLATKRKSRPPLPPGPVPLPIFGNLFLLGDEPHRALARLAKVHGPVMALKLGFATTIVVSSPDAAKEVLQEKDSQLCNRSVLDVTRIFDHADTSVVFLSATQLWKQLRSICSTNMFTNRRLEASRRIRQDKIRDLVTYFRKHAGCPVDFGDAVFGTVLNIMTSMMFSIDMADLEGKSTQEFKELVSTINEEIGKPNVSDSFPVLRALDLQGRRRLVKPYITKFFAVLDDLIDARLSSMKAATCDSSGGDLLDIFLQLHAEDKLDRRAMRSLFSDLFVAGSDTTSITLTWAMAELLRKPTVMAKARAEVEEVMDSRSDQVEESDVAKMPYLHAVVKEVLRLHPPAPLLIPHKVAEDGVELGGYAAPKGSQLLVNAWAIGRDERIWPEAEVFKPERFLGKDMEFKGRDFELIPFGSGRRSCPGMPMALRISHLALATLLHAFDWRLPDGMGPGDVDMKEKFGITLAMAVPLRVVPMHARPSASTQQT